MVGAGDVKGAGGVRAERQAMGQSCLPANETPANETPANETPGNEAPGNEALAAGHGAGAVEER